MTASWPYPTFDTFFSFALVYGLSFGDFPRVYFRNIVRGRTLQCRSAKTADCAFSMATKRIFNGLLAEVALLIPFWDLRPRMGCEVLFHRVFQPKYH